MTPVADPGQSIVGPFVRALAHSAVGKLAIMVFGFATLMVVAREVRPEDLGTFLLMQTLAIFLMEISSFGLHLALPKFMAERDPAVGDTTRTPGLVATAFGFRLVTIVGAGLGAYFAVDTLARLFSFSVPDSLLLFMPVFVVTESLVRFTTVVMQGNHQFRQIAVSGVLSSLGNSVITLVLLLVFDLGILSLFYGKVGSRALAILYGFLVTRVRPAVVPDIASLTRTLRFGAPLQANYVLSFIYQRIDTLLIAVFLGPTEVALYEIARRIPDSLLDLYEAFVQVYFPHLSRTSAEGNTGRLGRLLNTSNRWMGFIVGFGALIAFVFGEEILGVMFSQQYASGWAVFGWLMIAVVVVVIDSNVGYALIASGEPGKPVLVNLLRTIISIGLYLLLMPSLGAVGAAMTNSFAVILVLPLVFHFMRRRGVTVSVGPVVKPLLLVGALLGLWWVADAQALWQELLILAIYPIASTWLSIIDPAEPRLIAGQLKHRTQNSEAAAGDTAAASEQQGMVDSIDPR